MKQNFLLDNDDILFQVEKKLPVRELFQELTEKDKEVIGANTFEEYITGWKDVLDSIGEVCGETIAPNAQEVERKGLSLKDGEVELSAELKSNLEILNGLGIAGFGVGTENGGLGAPFFIEMVTCEMMQRACPSTLLNVAWYGAIAHVIEEFGSKEQIDEYVPHIVSGEWSGSMALTEPDAGSDLAEIRSYGEKQEDGSWKLFGTKRFISNGNGQCCLVLAKNSKGSKGLRNINLFICPRILDGKQNYEVGKIEEKIALHGSATCELNFDGSKAYLLGKDGEGFQYMLKLMNEARISVGFQALGTLEGAYRLAEAFALDRETWGKPIAHHELIAEKLLDIEVEIKAFRSLCYRAAYQYSRTVAINRKLKAGDLTDKEKADKTKELSELTRKVRRYTPLIKWWAGEKSFEHSRTCLQIHGGYGFTTEYRAEWWLRESLILSIYEGTSQIQALMFVKDTFKDIIRNPTKFLERLAHAKLKSVSEIDSVKRKYYKAKQNFFSSVFSVMLKLFATNVRANLSNLKQKDMIRLSRELGKHLMNIENLRPVFLHAERLCEMQTAICMAKSCIEDYEIDETRKWIAERYLNVQLARTDYLRQLIEQEDPVIEARLDSYKRHANLAGNE